MKTKMSNKYLYKNKIEFLNNKYITTKKNLDANHGLI